MDGSCSSTGFCTCSLSPYKYKCMAVWSSTASSPSSHIRCLNRVVYYYTLVRCLMLKRRLRTVMFLFISLNWERSSSIRSFRSILLWTRSIPPCVWQYWRHHVKASPYKYDTKNLVARCPVNPLLKMKDFIAKMKFSNSECLPLNLIGRSNLTKSGARDGPD